jgi:hypothetical protein
VEGVGDGARTLEGVLDAGVRVERLNNPILAQQWCTVALQAASKSAIQLSQTPVRPTD